ncbi:hypothetical protein CDD81_522 [Ophiocordyceps australis]|uniref:F-box domain-containing protein n=1 Tax=Ophiocordyceps australis TaxID=1399860 RepID=A0A2C5Y232_9HYPO|nr:hypothetical protein CDD81_522 [Ophiocordyceps australis]
MSEQIAASGRRPGKRRRGWRCESDGAKQAKRQRSAGDAASTTTTSIANTDSATTTSTGSTDPTSKLPASTWQRILVLLPPKTLGALLSVSRVFNQWLDAESRFHAQTTPLLLLKPDAIWQASRRRFWPRMPAPLRASSELDMWRLCCSPCCSFCARSSGVAPVFPGRVAACAKCLLARTVKEALLYLTPGFPTFLLPGLPVLWMTPRADLLPAHLLRQKPALARGTVAKFFLRQHVLDLTADYHRVQAMSPAAADEWIKGLEALGQQRVADASRWERWLCSGGVSAMRNSWPDKHKTAAPLDSDGDEYEPPLHLDDLDDDDFAHKEPDLLPASAVYVGSRSLPRRGGAAKAVSNAVSKTTPLVLPSLLRQQAASPASHPGPPAAAYSHTHPNVFANVHDLHRPF